MPRLVVDDERRRIPVGLVADRDGRTPTAAAALAAVAALATVATVAALVGASAVAALARRWSRVEPPTYLGACDVSPAGGDDDGGRDEGQTPDDEDNSKNDPAPTSLVLPTGSASWAPGESRSLYCSTKGLVDRGNDEHPGVALNLTESQGVLLVEQGLVTPAIFYAGLGTSCDVLPGFVYAGYWVDHVGDLVPGVAVYPYYVPNAG
ncbi:MAG: hypothetical protein WB684_06550 [Gaiella sp.]